MVENQISPDRFRETRDTRAALSLSGGLDSTQKYLSPGLRMSNLTANKTSMGDLKEDRR